MSFLIKTPHKNLIDVDVPFAHTDSEEVYRDNLKTQGNSWYYANNAISYKFNRLGYRMKQLEDVDYDNYYAFFGCSFTVGIGLALEETFAYRIAQRSKVDYINAAMGGSNVDFVYYNFINLMHSAIEKPKLVFINWPSIYRTFYWTDDTSVEFMLPRLIMDGHWERTYKDFIVMDHQVFNRFDIIRKSIHLICDIAKIPLFEMSTHQDVDNTFFSKRFPNIITDIPLSQGRFENTEYLHMNRARDLTKIKGGITSHPGFMHQDNVVNRFFEVMR